LIVTNKPKDYRSLLNIIYHNGDVRSGRELKMSVSVLKEKVRFTYGDYLLLPDDGKRYQIIEGEIYMAPAPAPWHQDITRKL